MSVRISTQPINAYDIKGITLLNAAVVQKSILAVHMFLANPIVNANAPDIDGLTPLHNATYFGRINILHALVQHSNIKVNATTPFGVTPLHFAVVKCVNRVRTLLTDGDKFFNGFNKYGNLLNLVNGEGRVKALQALLSDPRINVNAAR